MLDRCAELFDEVCGCGCDLLGEVLDGAGQLCAASDCSAGVVVQQASYGGGQVGVVAQRGAGAVVAMGGQCFEGCFGAVGVGGCGSSYFPVGVGCEDLQQWGVWLCVGRQRCVFGGRGVTLWPTSSLRAGGWGWCSLRGLVTMSRRWCRRSMRRRFAVL